METRYEWDVGLLAEKRSQIISTQRNLAQRPSLHQQKLHSCSGLSPHQAETSHEGLPTTENSSWVLGQMAPWTLDTLSKTSKLDVQEICCHHNVTGTHLTRSEQSWPLPSGRRPQACWPCLCGLGNTSDACGKQV